MSRAIKKFIILILGALLLLSLGVSGFLYVKFVVQDDKLSSVDPTLVTSNDTATLVEVVGKLILLPEGEVPTIASVSDPATLKAQSFFANSAAGDKVLIYTQSKRAVLYRPSTNQIIEVGTINLDTTPNAPAASNGTQVKNK